MWNLIVSVPDHCLSFYFPRYLMLSTFSRSVPSKVYEAWIFLIRFLVSCIIIAFDRLKSHTIK